MKRIPLTKGKFAIIDDEDFDLVSKYKWCFSNYAKRHKPRPSKGWILMHRLICGAKAGQYVDHINKNKLDNRKDNLRICTHAENDRNRGVAKNNMTGFKGVSWRPNRGKFRARIKVSYREFCLGHFITAREAAETYNKAALIYHGEFASLNII